MKKIYIIAAAAGGCIFLESGKKYSSVPPTGLTGATKRYCTSCHSGTLNTAPGKITVSNLPTGTFVAGQAYNFSLTITGAKSQPTGIWGFSIAAVNTAGTSVGTFSTTNPNAAVNGKELSHNNAVSQAGSSYTYNNLVWTAPKAPVTAANSTVNFYYVGLAGNGNGGTSGDNVYSGTTLVTLPIHLSSFTATPSESGTVSLAWATTDESNGDYFEIEKSDDGQLFFPIGKYNARSNGSSTIKYSLEDKNVAYFDEPAYYRLKLVDKDGSVRYSDVITATVKSHSRNNLVKNVYPTLLLNNRPITAVLESDKDQPLQIAVYDVSGRVLETFTKSLVKGENKVEFQITKAPSKGWVFAKFTTSTNQQSISLLANK